MDDTLRLAAGCLAFSASAGESAVPEDVEIVLS
jgi:hypothetical protein